jgi:hypothetical protein
MITFEITRNGLFLATVKAVSLRQACITAARRHGRVEVIAAKVAGSDRMMDYGRTEGRSPCNQSDSAKARIEAIRNQAIADYRNAL